MELPNRKHLRLQHYDYSTANYYFITICTAEKRCLFGEPFHLNACGQLAEANLLALPDHFSGVQVDCHVIMPNHIHAILTIEGHGPDLSAVVGSYKASVTRAIHREKPGIPVWQTSFYDHIIRSDQRCTIIRQYILDNPRRWSEDKYYCK